jgi:hypothetical protein
MCVIDGAKSRKYVQDFRDWKGIQDVGARFWILDAGF